MAALRCRSALCLPPPTLTTPGSHRITHQRWQSTASMVCTPPPSPPPPSSSKVTHIPTRCVLPKLDIGAHGALRSWTCRTQCSNPWRGKVWQRRAAALDALEESDLAVLVVGGGGLGLEAVRALVGADILVAAYQREEKFDIPEVFHRDIEEMGWDVIDVATIEKVLASAPFKAIVCTVGGGITRSDFDKDVPSRLVNAARISGVSRFILVSRTGVQDSLKTLDEKTVEDLAEEAVKSSNLNYTIIRPGELLSSPRTGNGILTESPGIAGLIGRADVAALILEVLFNENSFGKILTAVDQGKLLPPTGSLDGVKVMSL